MGTIYLRVGVALLLGIGLGGCGDPADTATPVPEGEPKPGTTTVREVRADTLAEELKKHSDKVVVVDFWATWCAPCVEKFPHLVALHEKYADAGLVCLSVCMDRQFEEEYDREKVLAFLKKQGATFPNFIVADPDADEAALQKTFGKGAGIPYLVVFDKGGRKIWDSDSHKVPKDEYAATIERVVKEQLAK